MRSKPVWLPDARMATFPDAPDEVQAEINDLIEIIEASVDEVVRRRRCWAWHVRFNACRHSRPLM